MLTPTILLLALAVAAPPAEGAAPAVAPSPALPRVVLTTSLGKITLELEAEKAPKSVANFLAYVEAGDYDGTIFHRVIPGFMVQGGGYTPELTARPTRPPVENEADNGLSNRRGTVALARTGDPNSATAQFFVNVVDNTYLDHREPTPSGFGYCVFARVVEGMDVVDAIAAVPTGAKGPFPSDVPREPVLLQTARLQR